MKPLKLSDPTTDMLQKVLDLRSTKQKIISSNIANAETPGFSPAKFEFENQLKNALKVGGFQMETSHAKHIPPGNQSLQNITGTITRKDDKTGLGDENGVDVDMEMIASSENQILYEAASQILKKKLSILRYVVQGGQ